MKRNERLGRLEGLATTALVNHRSLNGLGGRSLINSGESTQDWQFLGGMREQPRGGDASVELSCVFRRNRRRGLNSNGRVDVEKAAVTRNGLSVSLSKDVVVWGSDKDGVLSGRARQNGHVPLGQMAG